MRSLQTGTYTAEEVEAQLRSPSAAYVDRYELIDNDGNPAGDLDGVVTAAAVDVDVDRAVKGSLSVDLLPVDDLADAFLQYRVRPWFGVRMPDGGVAEYPLGLFIWTAPDRALPGAGVETWQVTLGDLGHLLDMSGPGLTAFRVDGQTLITDGISRALRRAGLTDVSGVVDSTERSTEALSWGMRRNVRFSVTSRGGWNVETNTTPETWRTVIADLVDGIGYQSVWFDGDGRARCQPAADLTDTEPGVTYQTDDLSIIVGDVTSSHDLSRIGNRVFARSKSRRGEWMDAGVADLNTMAPDHPLAERNIGRYVDVVIDNPTAGSVAGLTAQARREMWRRLATYQTVTVDTLAWPAHEAFDIVRLDYTGDREFDGGALFHEAGWALTLRGGNQGRMTHDLRRVTRVAAS